MSSALDHVLWVGGELAPETVRELRRDENLMVVDQIKRYLTP